MQSSMNSIQKNQQGASTVVIIIILALIGVGVYIGLQYIPQFIETGTVDTILENLETKHKESPFTSVHAVQKAINRQLNINQMEDLRDNFKVMEKGDAYVVTVNYERELNLIYEKRTIQTSKSVTLKK
jgi:hypothetical protein